MTDMNINPLPLRPIQPSLASSTPPMPPVIKDVALVLAGSPQAPAPKLHPRLEFTPAKDRPPEPSPEKVQADRKARILKMNADENEYESRETQAVKLQEVAERRLQMKEIQEKGKGRKKYEHRVTAEETVRLDSITSEKVEVVKPGHKIRLTQAQIRERLKTQERMHKAFKSLAPPENPIIETEQPINQAMNKIQDLQWAIKQAKGEKITEETSSNYLLHLKKSFKSPIRIILAIGILVGVSVISGGLAPAVAAALAISVIAAKLTIIGLGIITSLAILLLKYGGIKPEDKTALKADHADNLQAQIRHLKDDAGDLKRMIRSAKNEEDLKNAVTVLQKFLVTNGAAERRGESMQILTADRPRRRPMIDLQTGFLTAGSENNTIVTRMASNKARELNNRLGNLLKKPKAEKNKPELTLEQKKEGLKAIVDDLVALYEKGANAKADSQPWNRLYPT